MYLSAPAFTPVDSQLFITYQKDFMHSVKVLHHGDGPQQWHACLQTIEGHTGAVSSALFSPANSQQITSASDDFTVRIWDAVSGRHQKTLQGHTDKVTCLAWSLDGAYIVTGSDDLLIMLWDAVTGVLLKTINAPHNTPTSLAFYPNNSNNILGTSSG
jgi:WD40 repeat protein